MAGSFLSGRRLRLVVTLALAASVLTALGAAGAHAAQPAADHLLLSEIAVTPSEGEFVEIHNPTGAVIDLSDVYLTDATFASGGTFYYKVVLGDGGGGGFGDFNARFPDGASIAAGEYQTVAMTGSDNFLAEYGVVATYELVDDAGAVDDVPAMREATAGSIDVAATSFLSSGEVAVLYSWDGATDLVQDHDYAVWGDKAEAVDKTGVTIDGPDGDSDASTYLDDTAVASQDVISADSHTSGLTWQRADLTEGVETRMGGNGTTGNDETSEMTSATWTEQLPSPNAEKAENDHLLLSEIAVTPSEGEFVEIHNPTGAVIDLSDVYLSDATFASGGTFYYNVVLGDGGGGGFGDFNARFPDGASIAAGEYQTVAMTGSDNFLAEYGVVATYELVDDAGAVDDVPAMREATAGSIDVAATSFLSSGEVAVLYSWDGASDLVQDLDYAVWGDKNEAVDKSGVAVDGPDGDSDASTYLDDTATAGQDTVASDSHAAGNSWQRVSLNEGTETKTDGNGIYGDNETSENTSLTWRETTPTPNAATPAADHLLLSEIAVTPSEGEFVEIHNPTGAVIDLSDVYLSDATFASGGTFYYNVVLGDGGGGGFGDFNARFPDGASIAAGEYQTVAMTGSDNFLAEYGVVATYELVDDAGAVDDVPAMREATAGSIDVAATSFLSSGEVAVLYSWDGASDLVQDLDYAVWGDKNEAVDKSGVAVDGPDGDSDASTYLDDTAVASQDVISADSHTSGLTWQRADLTEGVETRMGGNGTTGNDETSEMTSITWGETDATPNAATTLPPPAAGGGLEPLPVLGVCGEAFTGIYDIQGSSSDGAFADGTPVLTEGVVTGVFDGYGGYNIQDAAGDGDAATSDGIFVSADTTGVTVGNTVRLVGRTMELFGLTEITGVEDFLDCGAGPAIAPTAVDLPMADREPVEGMLVTLADSMVVTDAYNIGNFGEVWLAADTVVPQPTNVYSVGDPALQALADENMARSIILDDGSTSTPAEVPYLPAGGTLRLGDSASTVTGVMHYSFGVFRINPTVEVTFTADNPRPATAPAVGGDVRIATFNVLNYWTTLGGRGASTAEQLAEQTDGVVSAIMGLNADVIGLEEMENDLTHTPITTLVDALNAAEGSTVWAWVGPVSDYNDYPIRNEIIYRIGAVDPIGDPVTVVDGAFDDTAPGGSSQLGRPPVAQTFSADGETFTVMANHFKSKSCTAASGDDDDMSDGQACYNARRVLQAERVLQFVDELQTASGDMDVIVLGDLNAYMAEDPILTLETGLTNIFAEMVDSPYTYNFFAASSAPWIGRGSLDHVLVTPEMAHKVTDVAAWQINGDEPNMLGWNTPATSADGPFRSSDHDPVVMGLRVATQFTDTVGNIFADDIQWVAEAGITFGCNPPVNDNYCPDNLLTRGQLAAMFTRALDLPATATNYFTDDDTSIFEDDINRLAEAGITRGCNPPANDNFCPNDNVTRGEVAAMFTRALDLPATATNYFTDDDTSIFEDDIDRLAEAGITRGCNPPANDNFCPGEDVDRGQIAAFWRRALG